MRRENRPASFADALVVGVGNRRLEGIDSRIDWLAVERLLEPVYAAPTGRASYPLLSLFKAVLLGAWHGLGDPELEAALADRLSFRRFAGLGLDEAVAGDEASVWADKAYVGPTMARAITAAGAKNRVQRRNQKNRRLRPSERRRNVLIGRVRGRVEGVFGALKRSYGLARLRYMSLARNATGVLLKLTGWNLARAADRLSAS